MSVRGTEARGKRFLLAFLVFLVFLALASFAPSLAGRSTAQAAPVTKSAISQAQKQEQALQERVQKLSDQAEILVENYNDANIKLADDKRQVEAVQAALAQAEKDLSTAQATLSRRLVQIYKHGDTAFVAVLLDSTSFTDFVNRLQVLEDLSRQDRLVVDQVSTYQAQCTAQKRLLSKRLAEQQKQTEQVAGDKRAVEAKLAANKQALKAQQQQVAQLEKTWQSQQAKLAAEARAAAQAAATKAAQEAKQRKQQASTTRPSQGASTLSTSGKGAQAVRLAMRYMGVPYVWGGSTPSGFDCSGLVMYVFRQLGVSLPHHAADQYGYGTHVSRSQLEPGDLVFFGNPIHHVGIYVGNGDMINAPHTGAVVRIQSLNSDYRGATRIF